MLLLDPLKLYVLRNELITGKTWDRLPLTTESNFTSPNSMKPFNGRWLQLLCHSSSRCLCLLYYCMSVYVFFVLSCAPFPPVSASLSLTSLLSSSVSQTVSFSLSLSPFSPFLSFTCTLSPFPHPPFVPLTHTMSFSTAVTVVFSSIYSEATRLLKAERLPWALLFAWDFLPPTICRCN